MQTWDYLRAQILGAGFPNAATSFLKLHPFPITSKVLRWLA